MKVLLTGATGFVGHEALNQCIRSPIITSIIVLSRRELGDDASKHEKVKVIIHKDFLSYPPFLLDELAGIEGCIWAIGGKVGDFPSLEVARTVGIDYTLAAASAFAKKLAPQLGDGMRFRFVYCSGWGAERDPDKPLRIAADTRRVKVRREF